MSSGLAIRRATVGDAAMVAQHRVAMFKEMGHVPTDELATTLLELSTAAIASELYEESYVGWLAIDETNRVVAGVGVHVKPQLPRISDDGTRVVSGSLPLVVNVYAELAWRGRGIARTLMATAMRWATIEGFDRVVLRASDAGRPLYLSLGFNPTNEMRWSPFRSPGEVRAPSE